MQKVLTSEAVVDAVLRGLDVQTGRPKFSYKLRWNWVQLRFTIFAPTPRETLARATGNRTNRLATPNRFFVVFLIHLHHPRSGARRVLSSCTLSVGTGSSFG